MAGKSNVGFRITPHKVSVCILLQLYAPPEQVLVPFPFSTVSQHNRLGLFLLTLTKACDNFLEQKLDELINELDEIGGVLNQWLTEHLMHHLSSFKSPDDLFNFFSTLRGTLGSPDSTVMDDQIILDPNSQLGVFLRRCLLAFNQLSFEGVCHLLTNIGIYTKEASSSHDTRDEDDSNNDLEELVDCEDMDLEHYGFEEIIEESEGRTRGREGSMFHIHVPRPLLEMVEEMPVSCGVKARDDCRQGSLFAHHLTDGLRADDHRDGMFLRTNWQVQGYLREQADLIEKHASSFPLSAFEAILKQLQRLAPELHRVHYLRYLNSLYHDDYPASIENLHSYFDYSAGEEGVDIAPSSSPSMSFGKYETALLCLGMMHSHFGHPKQALEKNDDTCLSYALTAICNLLSDIGISTATGIIGSSYLPVTSFASSLAIQQQLLELLTRSLKRAENLKLTCLVASNRLAMAKFELLHVKRSLLSFGPKSPTKLRTCPSNVIKELRLSSYLLGEVGVDGAAVTVDGAFSSAWLKNLRKPNSSSVLLQGNELGSGCESFHFGGQPSPIPGSLLQLSGSSYLLRATAWEHYGSSTLARLNALIHSTCFADASSSADRELAYIKLIRHLSIFKGHKEAFSALKVAEDKFLSVTKSGIQMIKLQLLHDRALHRGQLKLAQRVCDEFGVLASSAESVAHSLFCMCYKFNLQVEHAISLLLLAEIHKKLATDSFMVGAMHRSTTKVVHHVSIKAGNAVLGISYALASLSFCQSLNLDLLEASTTLMLGELWLSLGSNHAKRALNLVHKSLPMIFGHGGLELRARANVAVAKCYLSDSSYSVSEDFEAVLDPLRQASEDLEVLEYHELASEAFYLMAQVFNNLGQLEEREKAAASFQKHVLALQDAKNEEEPLSTTM
ncbi:hypothetical protein IFM89_028734 [Coptis chinensis]|uniref:Anaphase-promoting complex subunit 5 n=1 Tax=Coptis chinensis TaxID=261450 RepID=A0A835GYI0_9MAGN|nr:hypothetical protein IFM89_028734 [Coptis chinensis]